MDVAELVPCPLPIDVGPPRPIHGRSSSSRLAGIGVGGEQFLLEPFFFSWPINGFAASIRLFVTHALRAQIGEENSHPAEKRIARWCRPDRSQRVNAGRTLVGQAGRSWWGSGRREPFHLKFVVIHM